MPAHHWRPQACAVWVSVGFTVSLICAARQPAAPGSQGLNDPDPIQQVVVYKKGDDGAACVRTPILLTLPDGVLLAFGGARYGSCSDYHGRKIFMKRSEDSGETWSDPYLVTNVTHATTISHGDGINPGSAVFQPSTSENGMTTSGGGSSNSSTGVLWFGWVECFHKCAVPYQFVKKSLDGGRTWSQPQDITDDIKALSKFAYGPGYGLYLAEKQRILMCGHYLRAERTSGSTLDTPYDISESGAACIYSDDFGGTWKSGVPVPYNSSLMSPDECQPVLISKYGNLLMTTRDERNSHHPLWTQSYDSGESWEEALVQTNLTSATCDTSMVAKNVTGKIRLFYSHPASTVRENMEVHWKNLNDDTPWTLLAKLWAGPAGYSCMTMMPLDNVGVLYENGEKSTYEKITFAKINYLAEQSAVHEEYSQKD
ncbi:sialidase-1-like isoform X2 [Sycon ciliatum]|uniref:sialidase-1-like isoform X2 n=1 Tax=Sycon ciliatum TaxID=27933 RepID=UPI0031F6EFE3